MSFIQIGLEYERAKVRGRQKPKNLTIILPMDELFGKSVTCRQNGGGLFGCKFTFLLLLKKRRGANLQGTCQIIGRMKIIEEPFS